MMDGHMHSALRNARVCNASFRSDCGMAVTRLQTGWAMATRRTSSGRTMAEQWPSNGLGVGDANVVTAGLAPTAAGPLHTPRVRCPAAQSAVNPVKSLLPQPHGPATHAPFFEPPGRLAFRHSSRAGGRFCGGGPRHPRHRHRQFPIRRSARRCGARHGPHIAGHAATQFFQCGCPGCRDQPAWLPADRRHGLPAALSTGCDGTLQAPGRARVQLKRLPNPPATGNAT